MKRGKDEDKTMGPMFPRLHVNEIEKRGPRAPPRNKMALYEQLSIPSQRFTAAVDVCPNSNQGGGTEKGIFVSRQLLPRHQSEQYSEFSDSSAPVTKMDQRKELDDDDFRVPIFLHSKSSVEHGKLTNVFITEKPSPTNTSYINPLVKFRKSNIQKEEKLKELVADQDKAISNSSSLCQETLVNSLDSTERLKSGGGVQLEVCPELQPSCNMHDSAVCGELISTMDKRRSSVLVRDLSCGAEVKEPDKDQPRVDTISETSITDTISGLEITPDDVVGVLGQKRFWKARRAIVNQQRVFADQVFELHRLMKVQKSIALSPHFLLEDVVDISKPVKALTEKIVPSECPNKALPNDPNPTDDHPKRPVSEEGSAENPVVKSSLPSVRNNSLPPNFRIACNEASPWCFNQPPGPQWLVPVMSPSEGLVYKPYPGPGYVGPPVPGNNFMTPAYGVPAIHPQYQFPSFPAPGPHPYFPTYGMPVVSTASFSSSSVEQVNPPSIPGPSPLANLPVQRNISGPGRENLQLPEDIEVQASTASSRSESAMDSGSGSVLDKRNALRLFPTSPTEPECPTRTQVIKVIPHKAGSATESVARIFRSIQEERRHYDPLLGRFISCLVHTI
ncbi:protein EARLY FLOWERING 3-like [Dorcoceras hygrometricum]|uniref:Protein EARLY FLOWERING 3-like n=1 Tax=Dorcoceras hygrometricum TaxID=472368 RepID=A0A2Z7BYA0_9LAMI|nr:protein EARLY FLOWERING 3-like [Dorcoceras hygrometricum]